MAIDDSIKTFPTLLEATKGTCATRERQIIEGVLPQIPVFNRLPQRVINGTSYTAKERTSIPLIKPRPLNAGVELFKSDYVLKNAQCFLYNGMFGVDKALAKAHPEQFGEFMRDEATAGVRGLMYQLERSLFYGKAVSAYGLNGLPDTIGDYMTFSLDSQHNTDNQRQYGGASIWLLSLSPDMLRVIWGGKKVLAFDQMKEETIPVTTAEGKNGYMRAYTKDITSWVGFSQQHEGAVAHAVNESGDHPLTDAVLSQAVNMFPSGITPNLIVMNRHTRARLQANRASSYKYVKGTSGKTPYADIPTEYEGIPIVTTDVLIDDESTQNIEALAKQTKIEAEKNQNCLKR